MVHILYFWTLSIVSSLSKMLRKYNVSEIGFYLRPQVKPTQLGPIDRASPYLRILRSYEMDGSCSTNGEEDCI
jgi:hypothetical protein